jgi:hypothetical protein
MKASRLMAVVSLALGAGACANMGGNKTDSIAASRITSATPATVSFTQADLDGDARITREEFDQWQRRFAVGATSGQAAAGGTANDNAFDSADTNFNGVLTLDEWQAMTAPPSAGASRAASPKAR